MPALAAEPGFRRREGDRPLPADDRERDRRQQDWVRPAAVQHSRRPSAERLPTDKPGCPLPNDSLAHDSVNLKLTIRVPTHAKSFRFDHSFFSAEYPEYACSQFNDLWGVLLDSALPAGIIANDKDILFDNEDTPGSVNLNFFDRCVAGPTGCAGGGTPGFNFCSGGKDELASLSDRSHRRRNRSGITARSMLGVGAGTRGSATGEGGPPAAPAQPFHLWHFIPFCRDGTRNRSGPSLALDVLPAKG